MIHHTNKHQVHTVPMVIVHTVPMVIAIVDKDVYSYRKTRSGIQSLATVQQETTHRKLRKYTSGGLERGWELRSTYISVV